jgi:flagellar protein FlbD
VHVIYLSRLDGTRFVLNANRIETVEARPDTVITVVDGKHFVVKDSVDDVIAKVIAYQRVLLGHHLIPAWPSGEETTSG